MAGYKNCDKKFKESAYISLVRSVLDYSSTIWDPYHQKDIYRIETIQRRAAGFVQKDNKRTSSVTSMMEELGWKPLHEQRREQRLTLLYKIVNDLVAIPTDQHITYTREVQDTTTRCPGTSTWRRPQKRQTTPLLSCGGISQDAQARSRPSATLLSSYLWLSMQLQLGTPTLPEISSSSKLSNVEQQDLSQATTRPQAVPARWLLISVGVPYNREELKQGLWWCIASPMIL